MIELVSKKVDISVKIAIDQEQTETLIRQLCRLDFCNNDSPPPPLESRCSLPHGRVTPVCNILSNN